MRTVWRGAGLLLLLLLVSLSCSKPGAASPPDQTSPAEVPEPGVTTTAVPENLTPDTPPIAASPAQKPDTAGVANDSSGRLYSFLPARKPNEVFILDNEYLPNELTVPLGTTVVWTCYCPFHQHDVDCRGYFFSSLILGSSFSYTFTERGIFEYRDGYCDLRGTIVVE